MLRDSIRIRHVELCHPVIYPYHACLARRASGRRRGSQMTGPTYALPTSQTRQGLAVGQGQGVDHGKDRRS